VQSVRTNPKRGEAMPTKARLRAVERRLRPGKKADDVQLVFSFRKPGKPKEPGVLYFDYGDNGEDTKKKK